MTADWEFKLEFMDIFTHVQECEEELNIVKEYLIANGYENISVNDNNEITFIKECKISKSGGKARFSGFPKMKLNVQIQGNDYSSGLYAEWLIEKGKVTDFELA